MNILPVVSTRQYVFVHKPYAYDDCRAFKYFPKITPNKYVALENGKFII